MVQEIEDLLNGVPSFWCYIPSDRAAHVCLYNPFEVVRRGDVIGYTAHDSLYIYMCVTNTIASMISVPYQTGIPGGRSYA